MSCEINEICKNLFLTGCLHVVDFCSKQSVDLVVIAARELDHLGAQIRARKIVYLPLDDVESDSILPFILCDGSEVQVQPPLQFQVEERQRCDNCTWRRKSTKYKASSSTPAATINNNSCNNSTCENVLKAICDSLTQGKRVVVFCRMGISRSASICIAYFMKYRNMTFQEAQKCVEEKRSIIYPNRAFQEQLKYFETTLQ